MPVTPQTITDFRLRYPPMAEAGTSVTTYWLTEAETEVASFPVGIRQRAQFAYAAHGLASSGALPAQQGGDGVVSFRSGTFGVTMTDTAANRTGFSSTAYGREYQSYRARLFAGPRIV